MKSKLFACEVEHASAVQRFIEAQLKEAKDKTTRHPSQFLYHQSDGSYKLVTVYIREFRPFQQERIKAGKLDWVLYATDVARNVHNPYHFHRIKLIEVDK